MAPESITQDRIYAAIKVDYEAALFPVGTRIDLHTIADKHRASTTPVREAIHRLIGERLFEPHPDGGFRVVQLDGNRLAQSYAWYAQQILIALTMLRDSALVGAFEPFRRHEVPADPVKQVVRTDAIFLGIASAAGNVELEEQIAAGNQRLRYPRLAEAALLPNFARELETLTKNGDRSGILNVRRRITAYHVRRIAQASDIAAAISSLKHSRDPVDFP